MVNQYQYIFIHYKNSNKKEVMIKKYITTLTMPIITVAITILSWRQIWSSYSTTKSKTRKIRKINILIRLLSMEILKY